MESRKEKLLVKRVWYGKKLSMFMISAAIFFFVIGMLSINSSLPVFFISVLLTCATFSMITFLYLQFQILGVKQRELLDMRIRRILEEGEAD